jgi:hypothetical protein
MPATESQVEFIQNLISRFDPYAQTHYEGTTNKELAAAHVMAQPQGDYEDRASFSDLSKNDASRIIGELKELE